MMLRHQTPLTVSSPLKKRCKDLALSARFAAAKYQSATSICVTRSPTAPFCTKIITASPSLVCSSTARFRESPSTTRTVNGRPSTWAVSKTSMIMLTYCASVLEPFATLKLPSSKQSLKHTHHLAVLTGDGSLLGAKLSTTSRAQQGG